MQRAKSNPPTLLLLSHLWPAAASPLGCLSPIFLPSRGITKQSWATTEDAREFKAHGDNFALS